MKHRILLAILLYANYCIAQGSKDGVKTTEIKHKKLSIGYSNGYSMPIGNFARSTSSELPLTSPELPLSKFSKTNQDTTHLSSYSQGGFHYDIFINYRIIPHLSIMGYIGGNDIGYNTNQLNAQILPRNTVSATPDNNYNIVQELIGPDLNIRVSKYINIEAKALAGYTSSNYPGLTYLGMPELVTYTFASGGGFGYIVGMGIKGSIEPARLYLHFNINYAASNISFPSYSIATYTLPSGNLIGVNTYTTPKILEVSLMEITAGISFEIY